MFAELINKTILEVKMPDDETLIFQTDEGKFVYEAYGD